MSEQTIASVGERMRDQCDSWARGLDTADHPGSDVFEDWYYRLRADTSDANARDVLREVLRYLHHTDHDRWLPFADELGVDVVYGECNACGGSGENPRAFAGACYTCRGSGTDWLLRSRSVSSEG